MGTNIFEPTLGTLLSTWSGLVDLNPSSMQQPFLCEVTISPAETSLFLPYFLFFGSMYTYIQKPVLFLYINNELLEYEKSTLDNSIKKMKHSGRNPLKHAWDLHAENCERTIKESKADPCK